MSSFAARRSDSALPLQRTRAGESFLNVAMKRQHQLRGAGRVHLPLAYHHRRRARHDHGPTHADQSLAGPSFSARGFACGEHGEFGVQVEIQDLARFEHSVRGGIGLHRSIRRVPIV